MANKNERSALASNSRRQTQIAAVSVIVALGLIAAAVALIYGAADLSQVQRWLLICFLIVFPVFGLIVSLWLISRQNQKLAAVLSDDVFSWHQMPPEQQKRKLNLEVNMLAGLLPTREQSELRSTYLIAEDLALRHVAAETSLPLIRHVVLEGVPFDAVAFKEDVIHCVEVIYLIQPDLSQERVDFLLNKAEYSGQRIRQLLPEMRVRLLMALVTELSPEGEASLRTLLKQRFAQPPVDVDITFLNFQNLQTAFLTE